MSLPPGAVPFSELTPARIARADEVHIFDPNDPVFHLWYPVTTHARDEGSTLTILDVAIDRDQLEQQLASIEEMVRKTGERGR